MMRRIGSFMTVSASALLLLAPGAWSAGGSQTATSGERAGKPEYRSMRGHGQLSFSPLDFKEQLGLSKEQQEALQPIESQYKKTTEQKESKIHDAFESLGSLLEKPSPDASALKQKVKEISDLREEMMMYRIETLLKLRSVLSDEQQNRYRTLLTENLERFGQGMERHRGAATTP